MLLVFHVDYWEQEFLDNDVCSFGKIISWEKDMSKLARLIVKTHVLDLESVPQFIVLSDAEDFKGESCIIWCEIINDELYCPMPVDNLNPNAHFDFFAHGQVGALI